MAQVTSKYAAPSSIRWDYDGDIGSGGWYSLTAAVPPGGKDLYITWHSPYKTFQAQWRERRRLSPANPLGVSPSGATVWEEWGEWQGSNLSEDASIEVVNPYGDIRYLMAPLHFDYDFAEYDRYEYQVRVRVIDEPTLLCSEWSYETLIVAFQPQWNYGSATRNADGSVSVEVEHNMMRPCTFKMGDLKSSTILGAILGITKTIGRMSERVVLPAGSGTVVIPASIIGSYKTVGTPNAQITSYDNVSYGGAGSSFTVGQVDHDETIAAPSVTFKDADIYTAVTIADAGYDNVFVTAEWEDVYGNPHVEPLDVLGTWEAEFIAPPYGVEVIYRVTVVSDGKWRTSTFIRTVEAKGRMSFTDSDEYVELLYGTSWRTDSSLEGESIRCAGREKPVARYGEGSTNKIAAQGTLLSKRVDASGAWLPEVRLLKSNSAWLFRNPLGERMKVMVNSVATSSEHPDIITLFVSMTEVE